MEATVATTDTTPVPTTESAPAAPATSAPDSSVSTSERPQTARDLSAWMAKHDGADAPPSPDGTAATDPAATVQAAPPKDGMSPAIDKGPIPFEVHSKALTNARTKAVDEFRHTAGVDKAIDFAQKINTNAPGFWREMTSELLAHPVHGAALRSDLARMFGGLRQSSQPKPAPVDLSPDVEIRDDQGRVVGTTFSAERVKALLDRAVGEKVAPLEQERQQRRDEAARQKAATDAAAYTQRLDAKADEVLTEIREVLDIAADTPAAQTNALFLKVNELMAQNPRMSVHTAALQVRKTHVLPNLQGKTTQAVVDSFNKKAAGNTANGSGSSATPARPRDAKSLAKWMEANTR